ncbi:hypothetical protein B0H15DRAFT_1018595, partial [Mycena belliarum]
MHGVEERGGVRGDAVDGSNGEACEPSPEYEYADAEARAWDAEAQLRHVEPDGDAACADDDEEQALSARTIDGLRATTYADFAAVNGCGTREWERRRRRTTQGASQEAHQPQLFSASAPAAKHARHRARAPRPFPTARATCAELDYEQHRRKSSLPPPPTHRARSFHAVCNAPRRQP